MVLKIPRKQYVELYGPTKGDRIRLGDTDLIIEIEKDLITYGDELVFGGGKSIRDGMGQASGIESKYSLDLVITNTILMDPMIGIVKTDIGIKDGLILGIGKAGNPNVMDGVSNNMIVSSNTEVISGEHTICTSGTIDTHIHFISPQQIVEAICSGTTTMIGGGTDTQIAIHTDTLNECGYVDDTIKAISGRTIHTYHTEGAGGGHAPDILKIAGEVNVLPSSTNPTRPFTENTLDEHLDMMMVCHHLNPSIAEDVAFAESRIRAETIAAEDVLHDLGALSMYSSDSQAMGRVGEVTTRAWQTADKMKKMSGRLKQEKGNNDNLRVKRYLAKLTINPAITHGISEYVGSLQARKIADIVIWTPQFFGIKPKLIIKGGFIAYSLMGDPNASIPTPEPVYYRPMFGAMGKAKYSTSVTFTSKRAIRSGLQKKLGLKKKLLPVKNCRNISKKSMIYNNLIPKIEIDPETYVVKVDGNIATTEAAKKLSLSRLYNLF